MTFAAFSDITYIAATNHRNSNVPFGIRDEDRRSHLYVCGKTGTGKSHLLGLIFQQDLLKGYGCALLDPHGDLATKMLALVPEERKKQLVYLDPAVSVQPWRINPFAHVPDDRRALAAESIVETFKKLWHDEWGPRLEHLLRNVSHTLIATPGSSIACIPRLLTDKTYRAGIVLELTDPVVRAFWTEEFDKYSPGLRALVIAPLQNKVGAMLTDPVARRTLTEPGRVLDFKELLEHRSMLIVNLDKGRLGEGTCSLLGSVILSQIAIAGIFRSGQTARPDFFVTVDECHLFTTLSLTTMLSELRKYRVGLTLANQHLSQLDTDIRDAIFGNVGSLIAFRVGATDAGHLSREFGDCFSPSDLTGLPRHHIFLRLLVAGEVSKAFSATTLSLNDLTRVVGA